MTYGTVNVDSLVSSDGGVIGPNITSLRNRIINGAMMIDQRNAGASVTLTVGAYPYTLDRWQAFATGANATLQQVASGITGIPYVLQVTGAASNTSVNVFQKIESKNIADLAGSTVTLSALLSNSLNTTVTWSASYANSSDNFAAVTQISTGTFTVNSTLTQYSVQIALPANAANGVQIVFSCANQTSGTLKIGNVQLEKGSTATSFDYRPYGTELALCQRYCPVWETTAINSPFGVGQIYSSTNGQVPLPYPVTPRAPATGITTVGSFNILNSTAGAVSASVSFNNASLSVLNVIGATAGGVTAGYSTLLTSASSSCKIIGNGCEL